MSIGLFTERLWIAVTRNLRKADPTDARADNRRLIFDMLFPENRMSRASLGKAIGLSRTALSDISLEMIEDGLLYERGTEAPQGRGKPGTVLAIDSERVRLLCVDLSQPYIVTGATLNLQAKVLERRELVFTPGKEPGPDDVMDLVRQMLQTIGDNVRSICIAVPGVVNPAGTVISSSNLHWNNVAIRDIIEAEFGIPTYVDNDTNAALTTERFLGQGGENLIFVQLTRGVGASTLVNGMIVRGDGSAAGEIGHVVVDPSGPQCECGKHGCLETFISATALSTLKQKDPEYRVAMIESAGSKLGRALAMPTSLLDIHDVVIYGPPEIVGDVFLDSCRCAIAELSSSSFNQGISIRRCEQGADATLRGIGIMAIRRMSGYRQSQ